MKMSISFLLENMSSNFVAYHGTKKAFNKPDKFFEMKGIDFGPGFYFAIDPRDTAIYGPVFYKAGLTLNNPIIISSSEVDMKLVKRLQKALKIRDENLGFEENPIVEIMGLVKTLIDVGEITPMAFLNFLMKIGYDGIYVKNEVIGGGVVGDFVSIFSPGQINSWERVDLSKFHKQGI